uniref:Uncharacterized 25.9 kDa protein in rpl12-rps7 intergenic region n=1 Tax=Euglena longa TaxID=3037 RepID=YCY5_EUGLO|nr:hypothetical protein AsloCp36 [Euglena longa]P14758.1 RecName: Full=Uncharacterized 25.9 kDa protein in rpl12-rps7 intergenic region; AltName: Full=ORF211 [Euglena longa]CAC24607.1 hypothetical protein [Euglena longa]
MFIYYINMKTEKTNYIEILIIKLIFFILTPIKIIFFIAKKIIKNPIIYRFIFKYLLYMQNKIIIINNKEYFYRIPKKKEYWEWFSAKPLYVNGKLINEIKTKEQRINFSLGKMIIKESESLTELEYVLLDLFWFGPFQMKYQNILRQNDIIIKKGVKNIKKIFQENNKFKGINLIFQKTDICKIYSGKFYTYERITEDNILLIYVFIKNKD